MIEKAVLVGCLLPHQQEREVESSLYELSLLAETAQAQAVCTVIQKRDRVDPAYYIGKGKVLEVASLVETYQADLVIFNDELSPSQVNNLEQLLPCKVIDRTQLILDIFALRARSKEGKLQVELAQLNYLLPRIVGKGTELSRLGGGIGTRGPGETKLELDRRHIRRRIQDIRQELDKIVAHRERYRSRRKKKQMFQVALVGYTNAGKSTLLNQLTEAEAYTENQLFATLDPLTKQMRLPSGHIVLLTDTVGFIRDLPTTLVAAFRSTLEEVKEADLILHVIDSHDDNHQDQIDVVESLLTELDAGHIPVVRIFNKKDLPPAPELKVRPEDLYITALDPHDCWRVKERIETVLKQQMHTYQLLLPASEAQLISKLRQVGFVEQLTWDEGQQGYRVTLHLPVYHPLKNKIEPFRIQH
ncbi:GTP-binding proten HflX [Caldalkalibacillus thermarum TA2.A1]|uniref:GTPase HflX n=1 Tax=Caldalkalibacillus thermarum (strain TA2.A1) TaxID=986075 RepID=F5L3N5_CALTT|nr:GTPase HflX [Caldalkalibacillus thermarum]EGL84048.1 GTP-binding proten HflX [Caldalkalibacillus thermarum TA2.A1]QZT32925.1 GTPase HflX [Caldalkalibacillus thermarum TA2.A1]